jgi:hypothetical protein
VTLKRSSLLSFYFCSAYGFHAPRSQQIVADGDVARVGGC